MIKKIFRVAGIWIAGNEVIIDRKLTFRNIGNLLLNTVNGTVVWHLKTAILDSFKFRDNTKGIDYFVIDTANDIAFISQPIKQLTFADSPYTMKWGEDLSINDSGGVVALLIPTSVGNNGKRINLTKNNSGGNKITYTPNGAENVLSNQLNEITNQYTNVILKADGTNIMRR